MNSFLIRRGKSAPVDGGRGAVAAAAAMGGREVLSEKEGGEFASAWVLFQSRERVGFFSH